MEIQQTLIKQFVAAMNDSNKSAKSVGQTSNVYGTAVVNGNSIYVKMDGSDLLTPVSMATDARDKDRVLVTIKDHKAYISGNLTSPASGRSASDLDETVKDLALNSLTVDSALIQRLNAGAVYTDILVAKGAQVDILDVTIERVVQITGDYAEFKTVVTNNFTAQTGRIETLSGDHAEFKTTVTEKFTAQSGRIDTLSGDYAEFKTTVTDDLTAQTGRIDTLSGDYAEFKTTVTKNFAAQTGRIDTLTGDYSEFKTTVTDDLTAQTGRIDTLTGDYAEFKTTVTVNFTAQTGRIDTLTGDYAEFKTTVTNNLTAQAGLIENLSGDLASYKTVVAEEITVAKGWMLEGSIGNAQISKVSANKLDAGTVDTAIVTVAGSNGRLQIKDNTMQIKDANRVRVQVGKDESNDYSMSVWDAAGNLIWDALGATDKTIQRPIIRDDVVADDAAISGSKLDINSVVTEINEGETKISQTVIQVGDKTLEVVLKEQSQIITDNAGDSMHRIRILYALGVSHEEPPEDGWDVIAPTWTDGWYIWQKAETVYGSGETTVTDPICISGAKGASGEDASILRISSSRGTVFKNNQVATVLSVTVFHGGQRISDIETLREVYGNTAYLEWRWQRMDENTFGIIVVNDTRLTDDGFSLVLSPEDVDTKCTFECNLITN